MTHHLDRRQFVTATSATAAAALATGPVAAQPSPGPSVQKTFWDVRTHFGAAGNGLNDDSGALQAALNARVPVYVPPGCYRITRSLVATDYSHLYGAGRSWNPSTNRDSWIKYDGPPDFAACVIRASAGVVGQVNSASLSGVVLLGLVLDGNNKAGFGLYAHRTLNESRFERLTAIQTTADGIWAGYLYYCVFRDLVARNNTGNGMTFGLNNFDATPWNLDMNGVLFENLRASRNGSLEANSRPAPWWRPGCGILWAPHVGCTLTQVTAELNFEAGLRVSPDDGPNTVAGVYVEENWQSDTPSQLRRGLAVMPRGTQMRGLEVSNVYCSGNGAQGIYFGGGLGKPRRLTRFNRVFSGSASSFQWVEATSDRFIWEQSDANPNIFRDQHPQITRDLG